MTDRLLSEILTLVFPNGTNPQPDCGPVNQDNEPDRWEIVPQYAADVFAFCAYIIQQTGLMGFFNPDSNGATMFAPEMPLRVALSKKDRKACKIESASWMRSGVPGQLTITLWAEISAARGLPISIGEYQRKHRMNKGQAKSPCPPWWLAVFKLLIIADESCDGIGHNGVNENNNVIDIAMFLERLKIARKREADGPFLLGSINTKRAKKQVSSLGFAADPTVICIQPKGRVTGLGCSLRNLSRNLSVTGPVGGVQCNWQPLANASRVPMRKSLNLLLVPLPYELTAQHFKPKAHSDNDQWGTFEVDQQWLSRPKFKADIAELVTKGLHDAGEINGIIFPEMSLNWDTFASLLPEIFKATNQTLEFIVAGSWGNCDRDVGGNNVLTAIWEKNLARDTEDANWFRIVSQRKHHRWRLDRQQIATYGLASSLMPSKNWWESHEIGTRELNFFQFRKDAVFASLICEDLARNDPCHDIIRSVAPNLVFALLMDGPQLPNRWPARYAGSLADDPGCTVLTLSSFGLIDRSNDHRPSDKSRSVGLLRDSSGSTTEIALPVGKSAVLLTLGSETADDCTIDTRHTTNASKWYYVSQRGIAIAD
jgi:hypothetical protein